ncbi:hypothetical protein LshimejAT787_1201420 [Lyophyllum shimeji]|uniref:Uncharacterized protein n=1 Tax=Lyophyllum shimeji TaxID=47721 RepID=A0A9P3PW58_LYOSH|nr:hypothetical protein LshimejAT787_1201420 [Lyophyllum shimeji]
MPPELEACLSIVIRRYHTRLEGRFEPAHLVENERKLNRSCRLYRRRNDQQIFMRRVGGGVLHGGVAILRNRRQMYNPGPEEVLSTHIDIDIVPRLRRRRAPRPPYHLHASCIGRNSTHESRETPHKVGQKRNTLFARAPFVK